MKAFENHGGKLGVILGYIVSDSEFRSPESVDLITYEALKKRIQRNPALRLRAGRGFGIPVLLAWEHLPTDWREALTCEFGAPHAPSTNPLAQHFELSYEARQWYSDYRFEDDQYLTPEQIEQYTLNASVLNAVISLRREREISRKMRGTSIRGLWPSLRADLTNFNDTLRHTLNMEHTLPTSVKLKAKVADYTNHSYAALIDGRAKNTAAQRVTPAMLDIWRDIYAGQGNRKPDYTEVYKRYCAFLSGVLEVLINDGSGEVYDHTSPEFRKVSRRTVHLYQSDWQHRAITHTKRSGDRQKNMAIYKPYHKFLQPNYAGSMLSIDDRQPPFKNLQGQRIWFYNGIDLGSEAFTVWVYGDSKEGIIMEFYRQMVRNYAAWGFRIPYELECEMSLNSSFRDSFLKEGTMFQKVRMEANNARGKRIEAYYRNLRYNYEKDREGWLARPHAISEANQAGPLKVPQLPTDEIVKASLRDIENWNNALHSNQEKYPGMSRWDVQLENQHPQLAETNWKAVLEGIGYTTTTSMNAGRITLQHRHRVVGLDGEVAIGPPLINIMRQIEGKEVVVRWLDDHNGDVLKAFVYDTSGRHVCELLGDLSYQRAEIEKTAEDRMNEALTARYSETVSNYIKSGASKINRVLLIEKPESKPDRRKSFVMPGLEDRPKKPRPSMPLSTDFEDDSKPLQIPKRDVSTAARFK